MNFCIWPYGISDVLVCSDYDSDNAQLPRRNVHHAEILSTLPADDI